MTEAEGKGMTVFAASMSTRDLQWQIANAKKTGTVQFLPIFKAELETRNDKSTVSRSK
jgi:hypothetical protein